MSKESFIEDVFPFYFIFGESQDGNTVDLVSSGSNYDVAVHIRREDAEIIMSDRRLMLDALTKVSLKLMEVDEEEFNKLWYGEIKPEMEMVIEKRRRNSQE